MRNGNNRARRPGRECFEKFNSKDPESDARQGNRCSPGSRPLYSRHHLVVMMNRTSSYRPELGEVFASSVRYRSWHAAADRICEPGRAAATWPYSERHVQCVWMDSRFRPNPLTTELGERLWVDDPGIWNQEAGPDFLGAVVRIGPGKRPMKGDVEVHVSPSGWIQHGHRTDPRFQNVCVHATWFPGTLPASDLPAGTVQLSLQKPVQSNPGFSLDTIDLTAYPYAARAPAPPCAAVLATWHPDRKEAVLQAAGEERMRRKVDRLRLRMAEIGPEQALYEECMAAFGYKHNKIPFRTLAVRVPLVELRESANHEPMTAYALLAGCAGLLPLQPDPDWELETQAFYRDVWNQWWRCRSQYDERVLASTEWRLANIRPANHPLRRLMAAARLFTLPAPFATSAEEMLQTLSGLQDPYWSHRFSLGGNRQARSIALLGQTRIHAIVVNVLAPYVAATRSPGDMANVLRHLPIEEDNELIRRTAHYLFGPDHPVSLYQNGLRRQGLIQIFQDFCLNDRSRCQTCPLPGALQKCAR